MNPTLAAKKSSFCVADLCARVRFTQCFGRCTECTLRFSFAVLGKPAYPRLAPGICIFAFTGYIVLN